MPETPGNLPEDHAPAGFPSKDRLVTVILPESDARLIIADASATAFEAEFRHLAGRVGAEALGRLAVATCLLGADLKNDERLSIQMHCDGPLLGYLGEVDAELRFRGYTQKKVIPELDGSDTPFSAAIGTVGRLQVIRSTNDGVAYQGVTELGGGDVATDLERALLESQQIPSRLMLDHGYQRQLTGARGFLLQALPGVKEEEFTKLANRVSARADASRPWPEDLDELRKKLIPEDVPHRVLGSRKISFSCRCSRVRVINVLKSLGPPEGERNFPEQSRVTCVFCNDTYEVSSAELAG
jgi:molecular chaperone Hsp33